MAQFLIKRLIGLIFVLLAVSFITFILGYFAPGDPIKQQLGNHFDPVTYARLKHDYGLDLPWYQQYYRSITGLVRFDFGKSYSYQNTPVVSIIAQGQQGLSVSAELGTWGLVLTLIIGIPVGIFSALKANTWIDTTNMTGALMLYSIPSFVLAVFFQIVVIWLDKKTGASWPVAGWGTPWQYSWSDIQHRLGPILIYSATLLAYFIRITRTSVLEVLRQDYIRTARAKGLLENIIVYRHALHNALIPIITLLGYAITLIAVGVFFIEYIFNIPGLGQITLRAISERDYPVIQATVILLAVCVVAANLISDLLYTVADPRIRVE